MHKPLNTALPIETIRKSSASWIEVMHRRESASVLNMPLRDQLYRIPEFLSTSDTYQLKKNDISLVPLYVSILPADDPVDLQNYLKKLITIKYKHVVLFIIGADIWLKNNPEFIGVLDALSHSLKPKVSCIYFFQNDITRDIIHTKLSTYSSVYQNILCVPYFQKAEMEHFIEYLETKFKHNIPSLLKNEILNKCGGSMWLIKEAVRHYIKHGAKNVFDHEEMIFRLKVYYQDLLPDENALIHKIVLKNFSFSETEKEVLNYLVKINFVKKNKNLYSLTIPLFYEFIKKRQFQNFSICIDTNRDILINDTRVSDIFSTREKNLMEYFIRRSSQIVSRSDAASILWNNEHADYSDWSLDMCINRLRNKLQKLGIARDRIQTVKNKGFIFNT